MRGAHITRRRCLDSQFYAKIRGACITLLCKSIIPEALHSHLLHPRSICGITLQCVSHLPRLAREQQKAIHIKIEQNTSRVVYPCPHRDSASCLDDKDLRVAVICKTELRIDQFGICKRFSVKEIFVCERRCGISVRELTLC